MDLAQEGANGDAPNNGKWKYQDYCLVKQGFREHLMCIIFRVGFYCYWKVWENFHDRHIENLAEKTKSKEAINFRKKELFKE